MKTILVTGGAGYIGSHTTQKLLNHGYAVVVLDNLSSGFREAVSDQAVFVQGDIRNTQLIDQIIKQFKIDCVIHFAAKLLVEESVAKPYEYYENNVLGALSVLSACKINNIDKFIFSSTAAVYGEVNNNQLINEDSPTQPINPYGESKLMVEKILCDAEKAYGLKSIVLRYFNVAGAATNGLNGQRTKNATHLIKIATETALDVRSEIKIFGTDYSTPDGTCLRDYIHVEDLADAHVLATDYLLGGGTSQTLNCGYGKGYSVKEIIQTVKSVSGKDFTVKMAPRRNGDPACLIADSGRIKSILHWKPKNDNIELICLSAFVWEKNHRHGVVNSTNQFVTNRITTTPSELEP